MIGHHEQMPKVQLRDASNPGTVLVNTIDLPFEPMLNKPLYIRPFFEERMLRNNKARCFVLTDVYRYEVFENEPERSGISYLAREVEAA